ncbi:MAG: hypothetical protein R3338_06925, partial [Thermoanaerobaculia bacterium]|nr:hypothetical protein [Thermoanaerobaculia bacterium]
MKKRQSLIILAAALIACGESLVPSATIGAAPLPDCQWCGATEAPDNLSSSTTIAPESEPGERMILEGS